MGKRRTNFQITNPQSLKTLRVFRHCFNFSRRQNFLKRRHHVSAFRNHGDAFFDGQS